MLCGTHIPKYNQYIDSFHNFYDIQDNKNRPCQIFSCCPTIWKRTETSNEDKQLTKKYIIENNLSVFVHSCYLPNLCCNNKNCFENLKWEFQNGFELNFKGIVIHCGKSLKMSKEKALNNMFNNICNLLPFIHEECPFILETSSGQGSEVLFEYMELSNFYNRFTDEQKKKVKICIDTCHVFAAGHDPLTFIETWILDHPNSLILIHLNDSKFDCGMKKDRHAYPGTGYIGYEKMALIYEFCIVNNIPSIIESLPPQ